MATHDVGHALLKDEVLNQLAETANVAQFVSFAPGSPPAQRFCRIHGRQPNERFPAPEAAVDVLLRTSERHSVNVRSFRASDQKGGPFDYGLRDLDEALAVVWRRAADGLHTIVNETIDVDDGGVSGVALGGVVEFAPGDTPRAVEKAGTVTLERIAALRLLEVVYGFMPELAFEPSERVEFSVHPLRVGTRRSHTVIWERELVAAVNLSATLVWPNRFSRFLGDKAFGLLIAWTLGLPVPATTVIARKVAPFRFGRSTGSAETWLRTCPVEPVPGKFTTQRGWRDPFELLAEEDPAGDVLGSVLAQEGVAARWSGAALPGADKQLVVEGVTGFGDEFMLGRQAPDRLPSGVVDDVTALASEAASRIGPVRFEWAHDGERAWILQLHQAAGVPPAGVIYPGEPSRWRTFDPVEGLDSLRRLISEARAAGEGIIVAGDVGITSHVGDLLRRGTVPARLARPARDARG